MKSLEDFHKNKLALDGVHSSCKVCRNKARKLSSKAKEYTEKYKEQQKENDLKRRFNINAQQYEAMLIAQDFSCGICGTHQKDLNISLAVDHCHKTGAIRGLLCRKCNLSLGGFQDSVEVLEKAIQYLKE
jgi:hypothetical protein